VHTLVLVALSAAGAGVVHVVSGPDHLAAVAPLATVAPQRATLVGASWGIGHAAGSWLIGIGAVATGLRVNVPVVAALAERCVWGLARALPAADHQPAAHQRGPHVALHVGLVHGVAGSAQLLGILPALLVPTLVGKLVFLAVFGLAAAVTMTAVAAAIGSGVALMPRDRIRRAASALGIGVGMIWVLRSVP
jgi:hypothetical protein